MALVPYSIGQKRVLSDSTRGDSDLTSQWEECQTIAVNFILSHISTLFSGLFNEYQCFITSWQLITSVEFRYICPSSAILRYFLKHSIWIIYNQYRILAYEKITPALFPFDLCYLVCCCVHCHYLITKNQSRGQDIEEETIVLQ